MIRRRARLFLAVSGLLFCLAAHAQEKSPPKTGAKTRGEENVSTRTIPEAAANLVKNGGFEKGTPGKGPAGWPRPDGLCSFWVKDPIRGGMAMRFDTNVLAREFKARQEAMKQKSPPPPAPKTPVGSNDRYKTVAAGEGVGFLSDPMPVKPGQTYRLRVDCRAEGLGRLAGTPKVFVVGYFTLEGKERRAYKVYKNCLVGPGWKTYTLEFTPAGRSTRVTHMRVKLFPYWPPGVYYFDNLLIEPIAKPQPAPTKKADEKSSKKKEGS